MTIPGNKKIDNLGFKWKRSYCKISVPPTTDMSPYDYEKREYDYIDFTINANSLGEILQIEGNAIGVFDLNSRNDISLDDFLPINTKLKEITLYSKPIGENTHDWFSIVCTVQLEDDIVTWKDFDTQNSAWTEPIDFLRPFHFNLKDYSAALETMNRELINKRHIAKTST